MHWINSIYQFHKLAKFQITTNTSSKKNKKVHYLDQDRQSSYHSEEQFSLQYLCTAGDIGLSGKDKAKQEPKGLQQSGCHKQNQLPTKQLWQPTKNLKNASPKLRKEASTVIKLHGNREQSVPSKL